MLETESLPELLKRRSSGTAFTVVHFSVVGPTKFKLKPFGSGGCSGPMEGSNEGLLLLAGCFRGPGRGFGFYW